MSCVPLTDSMRRLLEELQDWPDIDPELREDPDFARAVSWGWAMPSGELTGAGYAHVGPVRRGIVSE